MFIVRPTLNPPEPAPITITSYILSLINFSPEAKFNLISAELRRAADESYRWHLGRALALRDEEGQILKWLGTNTDIEEQKQLEVTLARINRERELMLEEVSTPVVPVWRGVLALPILGS